MKNNKIVRNNDFDNTTTVQALSSFLCCPSQPFSVVRTATITHVLMVVPRCAPVWMQLAPVEAVRKDASATMALNSVRESVSQQRTVGAGIMENTMR